MELYGSCWNFRESDLPIGFEREKALIVGLVFRWVEYFQKSSFVNFYTDTHNISGKKTRATGQYTKVTKVGFFAPGTACENQKLLRMYLDCAENLFI